MKGLRGQTIPSEKQLANYARLRIYPFGTQVFQMRASKQFGLGWVLAAVKTAEGQLERFEIVMKTKCANFFSVGKLFNTSNRVSIHRGASIKGKQSLTEQKLQMATLVDCATGSVGIKFWERERYMCGPTIAHLCDSKFLIRVLGVK
jgi:hypothetical protein